MPAQATTLNVVTALSQNDPMYKGLLRFKQAVEKGSDNQIKVRLFVGSQLGNDNDILEQAMAGAPVAVLVDAGRLSFYQPEIGVLSAPYLIDNVEQLNVLVQSPMFEQWANVFLKGKQSEAFSYSGAMQWVQLHQQ